MQWLQGAIHVGPCSPEHILCNFFKGQILHRCTSRQQDANVTATTLVNIPDMKLGASRTKAWASTAELKKQLYSWNLLQTLVLCRSGIYHTMTNGLHMYLPNLFPASRIQWPESCWIVQPVSSSCPKGAYDESGAMFPASSTPTCSAHYSLSARV